VESPGSNAIKAKYRKNRFIQPLRGEHPHRLVVQ